MIHLYNIDTSPCTLLGSSEMFISFEFDRLLGMVLRFVVVVQALIPLAVAGQN